MFFFWVTGGTVITESDRAEKSTEAYLGDL